MPSDQPLIVARRGRKTQKYAALADLETAQAEHDRAEAAFHAAVTARGVAARRAHAHGLDWTTIGRTLGGVGRTRAREIANPKHTRTKETKETSST